MPAERRRELWNEPLPAAELATRLRELPLFASVSIDELYRIASAAKQVRHDPGTVLLTEGTIPETLHMLLDGRVIASSREATPQTIQAPSALGFTEALSGMPMASTIRTDGLVVTLAMSRSELRTLLADNIDLVTGLFATLSSAPPGVSGTIQATAAAADLGQLAANGLTPVERVLALQRVPLFGRVAADEMRHLGDAAKAVSLKKGPLFTTSSPAALWLVLSGAVVLKDGPGTAPIVARAGEVIGSLEVMSGSPLGFNAEVMEEGTALRLDREDLFGLLSERPELLRQIFSGMFRVDAARLSAF
jgi:CRP-like cAMP-binding protein